MVKWYKIIILICIVSFLIYNAFELSRGAKKAAKDNLEALDEDFGTVDTFPKAYSDLFSLRSFERMRHVTTWLNKIREPVTFFVYENQFNLVISREKIATNLSLKERLNIEEKKTSVSNGVSYRITGEGDYFRMSFYGKKNSEVNKISLILDGKSIQRISLDDTICSYNLLCNKMSIQYLPSDTVDVCVERTTGLFNMSPLFPLNVSILKAENWIYYFFMFPINPKDRIDERELDELIRAQPPSSANKDTPQ